MIDQSWEEAEERRDEACAVISSSKPDLTMFQIELEKKIYTAKL